MSKIIGATVGSPLPKPNLMQTDPNKGDYVKEKEQFVNSLPFGYSVFYTNSEIEYPYEGVVLFFGRNTLSNEGENVKIGDIVITANGTLCIVDDVSTTSVKVNPVANISGKGEKGDPGYAPVRGTDYWTDEDKEEIIREVAAEIPSGGGAGTLEVTIHASSDNDTASHSAAEMIEAIHSGKNIILDFTVDDIAMTVEPIFYEVDGNVELSFPVQRYSQDIYYMESAKITVDNDKKFTTDFVLGGYGNCVVGVSETTMMASKSASEIKEAVSRSRKIKMYSNGVYTDVFAIYDPNLDYVNLHCISHRSETQLKAISVKVNEDRSILIEDDNMEIVPPADSVANGKVLTSRNGRAVWDDAAPGGEVTDIFLVTIDFSNKTASHSKTEIENAVDEGKVVITMDGEGMLVPLYVVSSDYAAFEGFYRSGKAVSVARFEIADDKSVTVHDEKVRNAPFFDFAEMGMPAMPMPSGSITFNHDMTKLMEALNDGVVQIRIPCINEAGYTYYFDCNVLGHKRVGVDVAQISENAFMYDNSTGELLGHFTVTAIIFADRAIVNVNPANAADGNAGILEVDINKENNTSTHSADEIIEALHSGKNIIATFTVNGNSMKVEPIVFEYSGAVLLTYSLPSNNYVRSVTAVIDNNKQVEFTGGDTGMIPPPNDIEDGKVLTTQGGNAVWADAPSGGSSGGAVVPEPGANDIGKVLTVTADGLAWAKNSGSGNDLIATMHIPENQSITVDITNYVNDVTMEGEEV